MQFTTIHFLFLFLPIFLLLYYVVRDQKWQNFVLAIGSCLFFAWGDLTHLPILIASLLVNYGVGLALHSMIHSKNTQWAKILRFFGILFNLGLLIYYKYFHFSIGVMEELFPEIASLDLPTLPIGISFFTFAGISYIVDIYQRRLTPEKNLVAFAAYFTMFPKLLQGPIATYGQYTKGMANHNHNWTQFSAGIRKFVQGMAKKVLIADALSVAVNNVFSKNPELLGAGVVWFGLISFAIQIYYDFSGYTDMALGLGQILGFSLPENFDFPYMSQSITEFWRRWHITLSHWFRTYVFLPLEFKRRRVKRLRQPTNIMIVFLLTGLWHGADWNFLVWGGYFGVILVIESVGWGKILKKMPVFLQHLYSVLLILMGWLIFRVSNFSEWWEYIRVLSGVNGWRALVTLRSLEIVYYVPHLVIGIIMSTTVLRKMTQKIEKSSFGWHFAQNLVTLLLFLISISKILLNGFIPFLYEQF